MGEVQSSNYTSTRPSRDELQRHSQKNDFDRQLYMTPAEVASCARGVTPKGGVAPKPAWLPPTAGEKKIPVDMGEARQPILDALAVAAKKGKQTGFIANSAQGTIVGTVYPNPRNVDQPPPNSAAASYVPSGGAINISRKTYAFPADEINCREEALSEGSRHMLCEVVESESKAKAQQDKSNWSQLKNGCPDAETSLNVAMSALQRNSSPAGVSQQPQAKAPAGGAPAAVSQQPQARAPAGVESSPEPERSLSVAMFNMQQSAPQGAANAQQTSAQEGVAARKTDAMVAATLRVEALREKWIREAPRTPPILFTPKSKMPSDSQKKAFQKELRQRLQEQFSESCQQVADKQIGKVVPSERGRSRSPTGRVPTQVGETVPAVSAVQRSQSPVRSREQPREREAPTAAQIAKMQAVLQRRNDPVHEEVPKLPHQLADVKAMLPPPTWRQPRNSSVQRSMSLLRGQPGNSPVQRSLTPIRNTSVQRSLTPLGGTSSVQRSTSPQGRQRSVSPVRRSQTSPTFQIGVTVQPQGQATYPPAGALTPSIGSPRYTPVSSVAPPANITGRWSSSPTYTPNTSSLARQYSQTLQTALSTPRQSERTVNLSPMQSERMVNLSPMQSERTVNLSASSSTAGLAPWQRPGTFAGSMKRSPSWIPTSNQNEILTGLPLRPFAGSSVVTIAPSQRSASSTPTRGAGRGTSIQTAGLQTSWSSPRLRSTSPLRATRLELEGIRSLMSPAAGSPLQTTVVDSVQIGGLFSSPRASSPYASPRYSQQSFPAVGVSMVTPPVAMGQPPVSVLVPPSTEPRSTLTTLNYTMQNNATLAGSVRTEFAMSPPRSRSPSPVNLQGAVVYEPLSGAESPAAVVYERLRTVERSPSFTRYQQECARDAFERLQFAESGLLLSLRNAELCLAKIT